MWRCVWRRLYPSAGAGVRSCEFELIAMIFSSFLLWFRENETLFICSLVRLASRQASLLYNRSVYFSGTMRTY